MSTNWNQDIKDMHEHFGHKAIFETLSYEKRKKLLQFRVDFLEEELTELKDNIDNPEEVVDALIDLCVVAIGTLDCFDIDAQKAWDSVHKANMSKKSGVNSSRPNPFGLPDLIKPEGWVAPSHENNYGTL